MFGNPMSDSGLKNFSHNYHLKLIHFYYCFQTYFINQIQNKINFVTILLLHIYINRKFIYLILIFYFKILYIK